MDAVTVDLVWISMAFICGFAVLQVGLPLFTSLDLMQALLVGFTLSFSSTVFAVKVFEENGTMSSRYGQLAIGILVVQDIFAVIFMTFTKGTVPSLGTLFLSVYPFSFAGPHRTFCNSGVVKL